MWSHPPPAVSLPSGDAHVWCIHLDHPPQSYETCLRTLDLEEKARASRFHFEVHRRRFVVGRGSLRLLLAGYLETKPEDVRFVYGRYGKPALDLTHGTSRLRFNASHSEELAVYAFAQDYELGIDVEYIKADFASEEIARRFFSVYEAETLNALPDEEKVRAFFSCWTRKEAYIKAIGSGLSHPLDQFDVTLAPNESAALLRVRQDPESVTNWALFDLDFGKDYAAALAVEGPVHIVHRFSPESV